MPILRVRRQEADEDGRDSMTVIVTRKVYFGR